MLENIGDSTTVLGEMEQMEKTLHFLDHLESLVYLESLDYLEYLFSLFSFSSSSSPVPTTQLLPPLCQHLLHHLSRGSCNATRRLQQTAL